MHCAEKERAEKERLREYLDKIEVWQSHNRTALSEQKRSFAYMKTMVGKKNYLFNFEENRIRLSDFTYIFQLVSERFEQIADEKSKVSNTRLTNIRNFLSKIRVKKS